MILNFYQRRSICQCSARKYFTVCHRVGNHPAFRFYELAIEARHVRPNDAILVQADVELAKLRLYLRLCHELDLLGRGQYGYAAQVVDELGRLLGGWMKKSPERKPKQKAVPAETAAQADQRSPRRDGAEGHVNSSSGG